MLFLTSKSMDQKTIDIVFYSFFVLLLILAIKKIYKKKELLYEENFSKTLLLTQLSKLIFL